jgi:L-asparaginase
VFAGTGNGALSIMEETALKEVTSMPAASRPALVRSSRVGNGRVTPTAEYDAMGIIPGDTLNPQKARILLMLALTKTNDPKELRRIFSEY